MCSSDLFRNLKTAVIGPDLSHRRNLVKGLVNMPLAIRVEFRC